MYKYELPKGIDKPNNLELDEVEVTVTDLRTVEDTHFDIVRNGFQLERFQVPADISWEDDKDVNRRTVSDWQQLHGPVKVHANLAFKPGLTRHCCR